jgi:multisubunit Na+/H+ antiporter MnhB subunit
MRGFVAAILAAAILVGGCGPWRWPWRRAEAGPDLAAAAETAEAAVRAVASDTAAAAKGNREARAAAVAIRDAMSESSKAGRIALGPKGPAPLLGLCDRMDVEADRIDVALLPPLDAASAAIGRIGDAGKSLSELAESLAGADLQVRNLSAELAAAIKRAEEAEADRDSAIRQLLLWFIAAGVAGLAIGVALAIFSNPKLGAAVAIGSLILFGVASALYKSLAWIQWGVNIALVVLLGVGVFLLILALRGRWKQFCELMFGGEKVKEALEEVGQTVRERADAAVDYLRTIDWRALFNAAQKSAQSPATRAAVDSLKKKTMPEDPGKAEK